MIIDAEPISNIDSTVDNSLVDTSFEASAIIQTPKLKEKYHRPQCIRNVY